MTSLLSRSTLSLTTAIIVSTLGLSACGGSDADKAKEEYKRVEGQVSDEYDRLEDTVSEEYDRIEDDISDEYKRVEDKLSNDEKSMAEILESIFLPDTYKEDLDDFLDKITPEGGQGGLYVGHFVEIDDNDASDVDVGAVYFDIPKAYGSVDARISYQQLACQENNTLSADGGIKVDNYLVGTLSGSLDSPEGLDIRYVRDVGIEKPIELSTFAGEFDDGKAGRPWTGSFEYRDTLDIFGQTLTSTNDNCEVTYTLAPRSNFKAYPLDYHLGDLNLTIEDLMSTPYLAWQVPPTAALSLVSQVNVNEAEKGANGYVVNQVIHHTADSTTAIFQPVATNIPTNYAFVVQTFDTNNDLIGYQAVIADLPEALTLNQ